MSDAASGPLDARTDRSDASDAETQPLDATGDTGADATTPTSLGAPCTNTSECAGSVCYHSRCVPDGFAFIPAGTFQMGSPETEWGRVAGDEQLHQVTITRGFIIGIHEVTQGEWISVMGYNPSSFPSCGTECPVDRVRWVESLVYANALSRAEGLPECYDLSVCTGTAGAGFSCTLPMEISLDCRGYRLPTEAEWEYAYRAGTTTMFSNGDPERYINCDQPLLQETSQFCGNCSVTYGETFDCSLGGVRPGNPTDCGPTTVMRRSPNDWGIFDMAGNLQELVWDPRRPYAGDEVDPTGGAHDGWVRTRGGSFCAHMARARAADRKSTTWHEPAIAQGFRIARTLRPE